MQDLENEDLENEDIHQSIEVLIARLRSGTTFETLTIDELHIVLKQALNLSMSIDGVRWNFSYDKETQRGRIWETITFKPVKERKDSLLKYIEKQGLSGAGRGVIRRKFQSSTTVDLDKFLNELVDEGRLNVESVSGLGRRKKVYRYVG